MYLRKHIFDSTGKHLLSCDNRAEPVSSDGSINFADKTNTIIRDEAVYPWPIVLEEGVIVQDTDQVPFDKKWRPKKEAEAMKAKRDGKTKS